MAWKTSPHDSGTITGTGTPEVLAGETTFAVTGMTSAAVGRFIFFNAGQSYVDAAVVVAYSAGNVTIDKPLRSALFGGDPWVTSEDAEAGEAAGDLSENSNSNQRGYNHSSQVSMTNTGVIGYVGIKIDTFDIAQSTTDGPMKLEGGTGRQCFGLSAMLFANRSGGSGQQDGNEIIAVGANGTFWAVNTMYHSIQDTIFRMTGEGQVWWQNVINIGMTVTELRGEVWWDTVFLEGRGLAADVVEIDVAGATLTNLQMSLVGITMKTMNGFGSINTASKTDQIDIANTVFLNPSPRIVRVEAGRRWDFLNCLFGPGLSTTTVTFANTTGEVRDSVAVVYDLVDLSGIQISGAALFIHTTTGGDTLTSWSRDTQSNLFETRTVRNLITNPGSVWTSTPFSDFFVKAGPFGYQPIILPIPALEVAETRTGLLSHAVDPFQTAASYTDAILGHNTLQNHIPTTQTNPMTVVAYDGGSTVAPGAYGATVTCGTATGTLLEYIGDEISGFLVVENRNAVAFPDNTAITISASTFNGQSDTVTFNEDYSWRVDGGGLDSLQTMYNYCQAFTWDSVAAAEARKWYNAENRGYLIQPEGGDNWSTVRNTTRNGGEGVWLSRFSGGKITTMVADSGVVFTYPQIYNLTLAGLVAGVDITIVDSTTRVELFHQVLTGTSTVYSHTGGQTVDVLLNSLVYDPNLSDVYDLLLPNADSTINYQLIDDPNYENPA